VASVDPGIVALRRVHDDVTRVAARLDRRNLNVQSGARDWDVSAVLGHLGCGAEIGLANLEAARAGLEPPARETFPAVWARWDAMGAEARRDGFVDWDERLVASFESLDASTRSSLALRIAFLPNPVDVNTVVGFRLTEVALHAWDVDVAADPAATLELEAAALLLDRLAPTAGFLGDADVLDERPAVIAIGTTNPKRDLTLRLDDGVTLSVGAAPSGDATLNLPAESLVRLVAGRLSAPHTPPSVQFESSRLDLDDLRRVFPGF
jgi:uncharacterized protein (TIGR03083 family)